MKIPGEFPEKFEIKICTDFTAGAGKGPAPTANISNELREDIAQIVKKHNNHQ